MPPCAGRSHRSLCSAPAGCACRPPSQASALPAQLCRREPRRNCVACCPGRCKPTSLCSAFHRSCASRVSASAQLTCTSRRLLYLWGPEQQGKLAVKQARMPARCAGSACGRAPCGAACSTRGAGWQAACPCRPPSPPAPLPLLPPCCPPAAALPSPLYKVSRLLIGHDVPQPIRGQQLQLAIGRGGSAAGGHGGVAPQQGRRRAVAREPRPGLAAEAGSGARAQLAKRSWWNAQEARCCQVLPTPWFPFGTRWKPIKQTRKQPNKTNKQPSPGRGRARPACMC